MIELEVESNRYLDNLDFQINKICSYYKKVPEFHRELEEINYQINLKELDLEDFKKHFEEIRLRKIYKTVIQEYKDLLKKC